MNQLLYSASKTLKLTNVLCYRALLNDENFDFQIAIEQMQNYIKVKGAVQIGPLIQCTKVSVDEAGNPDMQMYFMLQSNNFIHNVEAPYSMESVIRISDCMYCRYVGPDGKVKYAYDKIGVEAFLADEELEGTNYTVYVSRDDETETIVADVFMPRKKK